MMKAIEFNSKISESTILIPRRMRTELHSAHNHKVRVVVFLEDSDVYDEHSYRQTTKSQFLKGYADSDSVYDL